MTSADLASYTGTVLTCALKLPNLDETYWGPEPLKWNPDRWDNLPDDYRAASMPGPAGLMTFSSGPSNW